MINYIVIGICIFLLIAVIYISAKPIGMGIEARRNIKDINSDDEKNETNDIDKNDYEKTNNANLSDEILRLQELKNDGVLTDDEYKKAKEKLLN